MRSLFFAAAAHLFPPLVLGPDSLAEERPQPPHLLHRERVRQPENLLQRGWMDGSTSAVHMVLGQFFSFLLLTVFQQLSDKSDTFVELGDLRPTLSSSTVYIWY